MTRQSATTKVKQNCPSSAHLFSNSESRTSVHYWRNKVVRTVSASGKVNAHFSVRVVYKGKRVRFPLETANKNEAASKAASIFKFLTENGWSATVSKYKTKGKDSTKVESEEPLCCTVGDIITTASKYTTAREESMKAYTQAFRKIVADIFDIKGGAKNVTNGGSGNKEWKESVEAIALKELTPVKIQAWRVARISQAGRDASSKRKATVTANSQIRNAKALFPKKLLPFLSEELDLPSLLPFEGVQAEKVGSQRYHSRINTQQLMDDAEQELRYEHPEAYKIFTLALVCGLRVSEIDHLLWEVVDLDRCTLHVQTTEFHQLKSEDSEGILDLSEKVCAYLSEVVQHATDDFVVSVSEEDVAPASAKYRCQKHLDFLIAWLRGKGVKEQKPIHTLRKEVGSIIASEQGIFAASRYLRHADIQVTASFYADSKNKIIPSIGK